MAAQPPIFERKQIINIREEGINTNLWARLLWHLWLRRRGGRGAYHPLTSSRFTLIVYYLAPCVDFPRLALMRLSAYLVDHVIRQIIRHVMMTPEL